MKNSTFIKEKELKKGSYSSVFEAGEFLAGQGIGAMSSGGDPELTKLTELMFSSTVPNDEIFNGEVRRFNEKYVPTSDLAEDQALYGICLKKEKRKDLEVVFFTRFDNPAGVRQYKLGIESESDSELSIDGLQVVNIGAGQRLQFMETFLLHHSETVGIYPDKATELSELLECMDSKKPLSEAQRSLLGESLPLDEDMLSIVDYENRRASIVARFAVNN